MPVARDPRCPVALGVLALALAGAPGCDTADELPSFELVVERGWEPWDKAVVLDEDGGWCWFGSPRVLLLDDYLIVGSVASGWVDPSRRGDVEVIAHELGTATTTVVELHDRLEPDDHDSPALLVRPDGTLLAAYARHDLENRFYHRLSRSADPLDWQAERTFVPSDGSRLTYNNLFALPAEGDRIYDFFRGLDGSFKPSYSYSDDGGETWIAGHVVIQSSAARPYVRYASNGRDTIHLVYTEGHPRDFDNSIYHVFYRGGWLHGSDGTPIRSLDDGLSDPTEGTMVFQGDPDHVAWVSDAVLDGAERPIVTYSEQVGSAGLPPGEGGDDIRYRYARWDGARWNDFALAFAGTRLYAGEDDYSGLAVLDPANPSVVYLSTNVDPALGTPLVSAADGERHWEIFRGATGDAGASWTWAPVTRDSTVDNLRPVVPAPTAGRRALVWLRGEYGSYQSYRQNVVAVFWDG